MERVVEDTKQVGTTTLATLQGQTQTMEGMVSDLDDIHFTLKVRARPQCTPPGCLALTPSAFLTASLPWLERLAVRRASARGVAGAAPCESAVERGGPPGRRARAPCPQKAQKLIRDLMKGLATDKCILSLLAVVVVLIVVALALRFSGVADSDTIRAPGTEDESPSPPPADGGGRKLLFGAGWD